MAASTHLMTWKEFEQLPDEHAEILEGELVILPPPKSKHSRIAMKMAEFLLQLQDRGRGKVLCKAGFKISEEPPSWFRPDVCFLKMERVRATGAAEYFLGAPELAVEIVSPSETAEMLHHKIDLLLGAGSLAVWAVHIPRRKVRVYLPDGSSFCRGIDDVLTMPEVLPGWELPVAKIFVE